MGNQIIIIVLGVENNVNKILTVYFAKVNGYHAISTLLLCVMGFQEGKEKVDGPT